MATTAQTGSPQPDSTHPDGTHEVPPHAPAPAPPPKTRPVPGSRARSAGSASPPSWSPWCCGPPPSWASGPWDRSFSPGSLTLGRLAIAAVVLGLVVLPQLLKNGNLPRGREWWPILAYGVMWFGGYNVALNAAEHLLDAGTAALLINVNPILVAIMAGVILKEGFPRWLIIGSLVAFAGRGGDRARFRAQRSDGGRRRGAAVPAGGRPRRGERHRPEAGAAEVPRRPGHLVRHHGRRRSAACPSAASWSPSCRRPRCRPPLGWSTSASSPRRSPSPPGPTRCP